MLLEIQFLIVNFLAFASLPQILNNFNAIFNVNFRAILTH